MLSNFLLEKCTFYPFDHSDIEKCEPFNCDHEDLNDFFLNDSKNYSKELLGKTYCFTLDENPKLIIAAFTVSNDSIKTSYLPRAQKKRVIKNIPRQKEMRNYPAVLIGRLGINKDFARNGIGCELMNFIKSWFIEQNNKTGCRYIVVDAYNQDRPINYYLKNDFTLLCRTEDEEKEHLGIKEKPGEEQPLRTRLMYFDLITLQSVGV